MAKINLLPWRAELREQRKKEFITINIAIFLLAVVCSGLVWMFFNTKLNDQMTANQQVTSANTALDARLKDLDGLQAQRDEILARMKVIQDLQGQRPIVVRLFDELVRITPNGMYLTRFQRAGDKFTIEGRAESPNTVSELLRNLESSVWFRNAFMNSFQGVIEGEAAPTAPVSGGVVPRAEEGYGQFVVSVDLASPEELTATISATNAPVSVDGAAMPTTETAAVTANVAGGQ
ncbi:MAG: PilN domain-containing protein [Moraxellaceae bacterium]